MEAFDKPVCQEISRSVIKLAPLPSALYLQLILLLNHVETTSDSNNRLKVMYVMKSDLRRCFHDELSRQ